MMHLAAFTTLVWLVIFVGGALAANSIVTENQKPGTPQSQWDLAGAGSTSIQGFATDISVNHGSTVNFKIQANTSNWRIDIYRLGYYQGNGARLVTTINKTAAASQPNPLVNSTTGLVDAGNWTVTASWAVPATAVSGVYIAHLVNNSNTAQENHIPFIVRADESVSDIVFQTSDTTWHAYNGWPCGTTVKNANLYGGSGPGGDSAPGRAYKVSYNRPIATRDSCGTASGTHDFLFGAEFAAIYWLEQNGYDVSYIAGVDTSRSSGLLRQHKIFTSVGHDEYWDTVARANVQSARDAGVNLFFMSGNEIYWKTRWEPDGNGTAYRTLVCYKETRFNGPLDPLDSSPTWTWTGTWRDPRFSPPADGGKPENGLSGTIFAVDSYRQDAIQVPYEMSRLRFWRNTPNVAQTASGGTTTLTQNILGYEWDASPDNGSRPPGLVNLSSTTLNVSQLLLDYGSLTGNGTATHNLTLYKSPTSGALVFGAGTVFWPWGLSDNHDGPPTPTDPDIQQATVNLLADMGAQPGTLQAGLVAASASTDSLPPVSSIASPAGGTFMEGQPVVIQGVASDVGGRVAGVEVSVDGGTTAHPASGTTNWSYTWIATPGTYTIQSRATDDSLNSETPGPGVTVNVTSAGSTFFGMTNVPSSAVSDDANGVELGIRFSASADGLVKGLRFYKDTINIGPHIASLWGPNGTLVARATFANETAKGWQTVLFASPVAVTAGTTYTASYHTNGFYSYVDGYFSAPVTVGPLTASANAGVYQYGSAPVFPSQSYRSDNYWVDVLYSQTPLNSAPVITSSNTASGTVGTAFNYQITATNNPASFDATGLPPELTINTTSGVITGTPTTAQTYTVTLKATNAAGTGTATLTLTVNPASQYNSLFDPSSTPATVTVNDPNPVELGVKFSSASTGSIVGVRFYKGPQNTGTHTAHLWDGSGNLVASATFTNETGSGWQTVNFATPVAITAGVTYTASYHTNGFYSTTCNYFTAPITVGPLTTPVNAGVYRYGSASAFPSQSYQACNYYVDVLFSSAPVNAPPVISPQTATGTVGTAFNYQVTATNSPTSFTATGLPPGLSINTTSGVITGTPTTAQTSSVTLSATNQFGTGTGTLTLTINPAAQAYSLFPTSSVPAILAANDPSSVELGVKFSSASAGNITAIRFYKGSQNTGTHTAHLWDASGNLLASATFSNETASGWQQVTFASPVAIAANTTYIASYHSNGFYSADSSFFTGAYTNGPLTALASGSSGGNGVYAYGSSFSFPSNSYNAANYWVDVVFQ